MNETKYVVNRADQQNNDELTHWLKKGEKPKYIKKIPIGNGKFRYVYEETTLKTGIDPVNKNYGVLKTNNKPKLTNNLKTTQMKKAADSKRIYDKARQATTDAYKREKLYNDSRRATVKAMNDDAARVRTGLRNDGYKQATSVKNSVKTLLGVDHKSGSTNASVNAGYKLGSTKSAAKKALKNHAKTAVTNAKTKIKNTANNTRSAASDAIKKGRKFLKNLFD